MQLRDESHRLKWYRQDSRLTPKCSQPNRITFTATNANTSPQRTTQMVCLTETKEQPNRYRRFRKWPVKRTQYKNVASRKTSAVTRCIIQMWMPLSHASSIDASRTNQYYSFIILVIIMLIVVAPVSLIAAAPVTIKSPSINYRHPPAPAGPASPPAAKWVWRTAQTNGPSSRQRNPPINQNLPRHRTRPRHVINPKNSTVYWFAFAFGY